MNKVRSVRRRLFVALLRVPRPPAPRLIPPSKASRVPPGPSSWLTRPYKTVRLLGEGTH